MSATEYNHTMIHRAQRRELWYLPYYILYALDYIVLLLGGATWPKEYVCFEMEARFHELDRDYHKSREKYNWKEYIF